MIFYVFTEGWVHSNIGLCPAGHRPMYRLFIFKEDNTHKQNDR